MYIPILDAFVRRKVFPVLPQVDELVLRAQFAIFNVRVFVRLVREKGVFFFEANCSGIILRVVVLNGLPTFIVPYFIPSRGFCTHQGSQAGTDIPPARHRAEVIEILEFVGLDKCL